MTGLVGIDSLTRTQFVYEGQYSERFTGFCTCDVHFEKSILDSKGSMRTYKMHDGRDLPKRVGGPVHLIACHKTVTESQAIRQLGFPDAIVVSAPFGIYVADDVQKIQMVFIANCRDESTTQAHVQRFLQWLDEQSVNIRGRCGHFETALA